MTPLFLFLACSSQTTRSSHVDTSLWVGEFQACKKYTDLDVISYCIYQHASSLYTIDDVNTYCSLTMKWEEACRHAWAANRIKQAQPSDFDILIAGCAGFSDCAMEFLDGLPTQDTKLQRTRCQTYVQADQEDCLRHAMQMWVNGSPSKKTAANFLRENPYLSNIEIQYVAELSYCKGWNLCSESSNNHIKCRATIKDLKRTPNTCRTNWGKQAPQ